MTEPFISRVSLEHHAEQFPSPEFTKLMIDTPAGPIDLCKLLPVYGIDTSCRAGSDATITVTFGLAGWPFKGPSVIDRRSSAIKYLRTRAKLFADNAEIAALTITLKDGQEITVDLE